MLGTATLDALARTKVAVFGLGGVGSWCAESLVRSGIGKLLLVDSDRVCITNVNRQLMATTKTAGQVKVDVLARRLKEINPLVELDVRQQIYSPETAGEFALDEYDYVIDAIDSLREKAALIRHALSIPTVTLFASMGAALKMDPFQIRATEFRKVARCAPSSRRPAECRHGSSSACGVRSAARTWGRQTRDADSGSASARRIPASGKVRSPRMNGVPQRPA